LLIRYSILYLLARGGPALINFLALAVYTRLLTPEHYGQYSLVLAGMVLIQFVCFEWLGLCLARFLPANKDSPERFLSEIKFLFAMLALIFSVVGLVVALLWPDPLWQRLVALAVPLLSVHAWFELNLKHASTTLKPGLYARISLTRSTVALAAGSLLAWLGLGAYAPLWGLLLGGSLATLFFGRHVWRGLKFVRPDSERTRTLLAYGMPLAVNFALVWVVSSSDRFLIGWLLDVGSAGQYAVGYDLALHSIGMLLMIINLAAYPLAVHALERNGTEAAQAQLRTNGAVMFSVAFTAAACVAILAPLLGGLLLGVEYGNTTAELLPWVAPAAALAGIKAYYFDTAFHLGRGTVKLVWISVGASVVNVIFNLIWIPHYGILGAAYATLLTYALGTLASAWLGRHSFILPGITSLVVPAVIVSAPTAIAVWMVMQFGGWTGLGFGLLVGTFTATLCAITINLAGVRQGLWQWIQAQRADSQL
jgi:O-antigen/teichoic acid export membrane protein